MRGTALRDHIAGATFALAALGGDTQLELYVVKAETRTHVAGDITVRNALAYTNDHGGKQSGWLLKIVHYKYESVAFAIPSFTYG